MTMLGYAYRYLQGRKPMKTCPLCGHDLTAHDGVLIEVTNGFQPAVNIPSRLDQDGNLEDPSGAVAAGHHSATLCGGCQEMLIDMEDVDEVDVT